METHLTKRRTKSQFRNEKKIQEIFCEEMSRNYGETRKNQYFIRISVTIAKKAELCKIHLSCVKMTLLGQ